MDTQCGQGACTRASGKTDGKDERIKWAEKHIHAVNATKPEKETQGSKELILCVYRHLESHVARCWLPIRLSSRSANQEPGT